MNTALSFVPILIIQVPLVIFAGWIAPKMGARRSLWIVLTAIPIVGLFAAYVLMALIIGTVLDKLNLLLERR